MRLGDTIAAISTGAGTGPRCILRVSGPGTPSVLASLAAPGEDPKLAPGVRTLRITPLSSDPSLSIAISVWGFCRPRSYTGEDAAELIFPGGAALRRALLDRVLGIEGVRPAEPGEFTARAYLNGKLTPEQAEGVAAVIAAASAEQLHAARELLEGRTGETYRSLADDLASALALVEAGIDFTDQDDVVAIAPAELTRRLTPLRDTLAHLLGPSAGPAQDAGEPVVVLVGAPNAGKSTLFNALLGRNRAVVSPQAGTTRDAVEQRAVIEGVAVRLVDLAGLDAALASRSTLDALGQSRARERIASADVLLLCAPWGQPWPDAGGGGGEGGAGGCGGGGAGQRPLRVRTKSDLVHRGDPQDSSDRPEASLKRAAWHGSVCALDGWGLGALKRAIADAAGGSASSGSARGTLVPRHRACLGRALAGVRTGLDRAASQADSPSLAEAEVIAGDLREALDALGEVAGQISPDDVIGRVFATFCVGK